MTLEFQTYHVGEFVHLHPVGDFSVVVADVVVGHLQFVVYEVLQPEHILAITVQLTVLALNKTFEMCYMYVLVYKVSIAHF